MTVFIIILILLIIFVIYGSYQSIRYGSRKKVRMKVVNPETGQTIRAGNGRSYGSAAVDLCRKLYESAPMTKISGIQEKINAINNILSEYDRRMLENDKKTCASYKFKLQKRIDDLRRQEEEKEQQIKRYNQRVAAERRQKEQEKEKARIEKERHMSEQRRYIAAQRRLMTDSLRYDVMHRDGFRCVLCGASPKDNPNVKLHVDHIIPLSKGGKTEISNLRTLCERCNLGKRDKIENGTIVEKDSDTVKTEKAVETAPPQPQKEELPKLSHELLLEEIKKANADYIDNYSKGGSTYFYDYKLAESLKKKGFTVDFAPNGTKFTNDKPAWYVKANRL